MVRSFAHMPLGISDHNKMVLWPGCGGRAEFSLDTNNMQSVWFVVKRRECCCNLSGGVALIVWFTTNGMCVKNTTIIYVAQASNSKRDCEHDLYCCLLPWCEALRTYHSGFPIATVPIAKLWKYLLNYHVDCHKKVMKFKEFSKLSNKYASKKGCSNRCFKHPIAALDLKR